MQQSLCIKAEAPFIKVNFPQSSNTDYWARNKISSRFQNFFYFIDIRKRPFPSAYKK